MKNAALLYFCDLTHTPSEDSVSSNVAPLAVGLLAAHLKSTEIGHYLDINLIKYPSELSNKLSQGRIPKVIGFSNYSWNFELSLAYARKIKIMHPNCVVVFGGPNYGLSEGEKNNFWARCSGVVDFVIVFEGEIAIHRLLKKLIEHDFAIKNVQLDAKDLLNTHFVMNSGDTLIETPTAPRIDLECIPSPYLEGLMDKFFDGRLIPLTHTTRGCPFKCTFCSEGASYYNKVKQRVKDFDEEIRYIASRSVAVGVYDLMLSDANFGMFAQDQERSSIISNVKKSTGYPRNIYVSTGKNQKERVLDTVSKLDGAVQLSASLQTTNPQVLEQISRKNIDLHTLADSALQAREQGIATYSELILGLPGETLDSHITSIIHAIKAGFDNIRIYQLILLPQTEMNTLDNRSKYKLETKFRPMPRSAGCYSIFDETLSVCEYEEIVVSTSTLPHHEYIVARKIGLLVELMHNGGIFLELKNLINQEQHSAWSDFIRFSIDNMQMLEHYPEVLNVFNDFVGKMSERLFDSPSQLAHLISQQPDAWERLTANELAHAKSLLIFKNFKQLNDLAYSLAREFFEATGRQTAALNELKERSLLAKNNLLELELDSQDSQKTPTLSPPANADVSLNYAESCNSKKRIFFEHSPQQKCEIGDMIRLYGTKPDGLARIIMRYPNIQKLFRESRESC